MIASQHLKGATEDQPDGHTILEYSCSRHVHIMSLQTDHQTLDGCYRSLRGCGGPYEPSIASSASSSQASIFSDPLSLQSSIASSISDDFRHNQEDARDRAYAQTQIQQKAAYECQTSFAQAKAGALLKGPCPAAPSYADVTSFSHEQRKHPRRCSLQRSQKPPTLQRQCERKVSFVENLVGKRYHTSRYDSRT